MNLSLSAISMQAGVLHSVCRHHIMFLTYNPNNHRLLGMSEVGESSGFLSVVENDGHHHHNHHLVARSVMATAAASSSSSPSYARSAMSSSSSQSQSSSFYATSASAACASGRTSQERKVEALTTATTSTFFNGTNKASSSSEFDHHLQFEPLPYLPMNYHPSHEEKNDLSSFLLSDDGNIPPLRT